MCMFESAAHLALTATTTQSSLQDLIRILNFWNPSIVSCNPDRPNIFLDVRKRLPNIRKYDKLDQIIQPLAEELRKNHECVPLTIVYVENLESLAYMYMYLNYELKDMAYVGEKLPHNKIFMQYHADYPEDMKQIIVRDLCSVQPKIKLVLATVALGMGLNAPSIQRIIHCRPPTTLEKYLQEIGRAGRNGQQSEAILYYNNSDIAPCRAGLQRSVIDYCNNQSQCYRHILMKYFGFDDVLFNGDKRNCCSFCRRRLL